MSETMEERVRQLEIDYARQDEVVKGLSKVVEDNTAAINALTEVLNKGKGAAQLINLAASAGVGGLIVSAINYFKG